MGYDPVVIGAKLFADSRLSEDGSISCARCHEESKAYTDGRPIAIGLRGQAAVRNTPSLTTVAAHRAFSWDGRQVSLEQQVLSPLLNSREHGLHSRDVLVSTVQRLRDYPAAFRDHLTAERIASALAFYVRSLSAAKSRFDRYWFDGQRAALSETERRGLEFFRGPGGCAGCHLVSRAAAPFTDDDYHAAGLDQRHMAQDLAKSTQRSVNARPGELERLITSDPDIAALGRFNVTHRPADIGKYRTPSLRNVALTAPYMHDGSIKTLEEVVDFEIYYRSTQQKAPIILTPRERADVVAFLRSLTSENLEQAEGRH
jgi:cytochrome c peroxidase